MGFRFLGGWSSFFSERLVLANQEVPAVPLPSSQQASSAAGCSGCSSAGGTTPSNLIVEDASRLVNQAGFSAGNVGVACSSSKVPQRKFRPAPGIPLAVVPQRALPQAAPLALAAAFSGVTALSWLVHTGFSQQTRQPIVIDGVIMPAWMGWGWSLLKNQSARKSGQELGSSGSALEGVVSDWSRKLASVCFNQSGTDCSRLDGVPGTAACSSASPLSPEGEISLSSSSPPSGGAINPPVFNGAWQYLHSSRSGGLGLPHNGQIISVILYPP